MSTRVAPNINRLPPRVVMPNGLDSKKRSLPVELLPKKEVAQRLPALSAARVLSKAEKFTTDFFNRTKELEQLDAYNENITTYLNLRNNQAPPIAKNVRVVNVDEIAAKVNAVGNRGLNADISPTGMPPPQGPRSQPSSRRGTERANNVAQLNPLTRELSTTSTQTMRNMQDASTSSHSVTGVGTMATQTDPETEGRREANMAVDPPLTQIIHNHTYQNQHTINNYLHNIQNHFLHHTDATQNTHIVNNTLENLNMLNMYQNGGPSNAGIAYNLIAEDPARITHPGAPLQIAHPNRLLIEFPQNEPVQLAIPEAAPRRRDSLPAYNDVNMDWAVEPPGNGGLPPPYEPRRRPVRRRLEAIVMPRAIDPPPYPLLIGANRTRPRIVQQRRGAAQVAGRILERQRNPIVSLPTIPVEHQYVRPVGVPELRIRDEGWYMQGIDDAPKPPTKRKGSRLVKDAPSKRRR